MTDGSKYGGWATGRQDIYNAYIGTNGVYVGHVGVDYDACACTPLLGWRTFRTYRLTSGPP